MRHYELVIIFKPSIVDSTHDLRPLDKTKSKYKEIIESKGGELYRVEDWEKIKSIQAYAVTKEDRFCYYLLMNFECGNEELQELKQHMAVNDMCVRFLITKQDKKQEGDSLFLKSMSKPLRDKKNMSSSSRSSHAKAITS
jgi:small subunit ribosomal protein S6